MTDPSREAFENTYPAAAADWHDGIQNYVAFAAHYEPQLRVINLTRDSGADSLAHEWAHGLDHYMAQVTFSADQQFKSPTTLITDVMVDVAAKTHRPALQRQLSLLMQEFGRSQDNAFYQAALRIEALKGARKSYWQTPSALWARSFNAYVQDALSAKGESSPWLVHGTRTRDQHDPLVSAYPDGEQRQRLQQLWSACMEVLRGG